MSDSNLYHVYLKHPFTMIVSGPTGSGKTMWVKNLIEKRSVVSYPPPTRITYCYGTYQSLFTEMNNVTFIPGISEDVIENLGADEPQWLIIDDLMTESANSRLISDLFVKGSHHRNISIILLIQNFSMKGSENRNISLNSQYIVLFKNPRDKSMASNIARQMYPRKTKFFQKIFDDATKKPHSYLFIDLKSDTPEEMRLLSNVLGEEEYVSVYSSV